VRFTLIFNREIIMRMKQEQLCLFDIGVEEKGRKGGVLTK
jgi:hypothetical protein